MSKFIKLEGTQHPEIYSQRNKIFTYFVHNMDLQAQHNIRFPIAQILKLEVTALCYSMLILCLQTHFICANFDRYRAEFRILDMFINLAAYNYVLHIPSGQSFKSFICYTREHDFCTWKIYCVSNVTFHAEFKYVIKNFSITPSFCTMIFFIIDFSEF